MKTTFEIYRSKKNGETRWRVRRGKITGDGGEGYKRRATLLRTLTRMIESIRTGNYEIVDLTK